MLPFKLRALIGETETDVSPIGNTFTLGSVTVLCMDSGEILVTAENEAPKKIRLFYALNLTKARFSSAMRGKEATEISALSRETKKDICRGTFLRQTEGPHTASV